MSARTHLMGVVARFFPTQYMGERRWLAGLWRLFFYAIGPKEAFRFRTRDYEMYAVPDRWHLSRMVVRTGRWELFNTRLFRARLRPGMVVVDVGANFGHYALTAANHVGPDGLVLAFEPIPSVFQDLHRNITLARHDNVRAFSMALGDENGQTTIVVDTSTSGWSSLVAELVPNPGERIDVPMRRLADVLAHECPERKVGMIKIDTEGFEAQVISGAWEVLKRDLPIVITEFSQDRIQRAGQDPDELLRNLLDIGYRINIIDERAERLLPAQPPLSDWAERHRSALNFDADKNWFTYVLLEPE